MGPNNNKNAKKIALSTLPSLPEVLLQLLQRFTRDGAHYPEIGELLRHDPALCAKVLELAYPSFSVNPRRFVSLEHTLTEVGIDTLKTMVYSAAVNQVFHRAGEPSQTILIESWRRWVHVGYLARAIAEKSHYASPEEAYLAGLLHQTGKLALAAGFPVAYQAFESEDSNQDIAQRERLHFGMTSEEATIGLVREFKMASFMQDAIAFHREPVERLITAHPLVQILHLAAAMAKAQESGQPQPFTAGERLLRLAPSSMEEIIAKAAEDLQAATKQLRMTDAHNSPDISTLDKLRRVRLTNEVREIGLLARMRPNFSGFRTEVDIFEAIRKALHVLFDFGSPMFFRHDPRSNTLIGVSLPGQSDLIAQLAVPMASEGSVLVDAVARNEPMHSFALAEDKQSVIDRQIIGLTKQEGILCLALLGRRDIIGAVALGIGRDQLPRLEQQLKLLGTLTTQAGLALDAARKRRRGTADEPHSAPTTLSLSDLRTIVHEVNNPLTIMKNYIKILRYKLVAEDPAQRDLAVIDEEINRVGTILRGLVEPASERPAFKPESLDVNSLIFDLTRVTDDALIAQRNVRLRTEFHHALSPVVADRDRLKQVLVNLIKNAAEAMPDGGTITIATRDNVVHDGKSFVEVQVRDDGPGIPEAVMAQLYEPGVTTKQGDHAGLGLSIVKSLVAEFRGQIHCTSEPGRGTIFQIWLPKDRS